MTDEPNKCDCASVAITEKVIEHLEKKPETEKLLLKGLIIFLIILAVSVAIIGIFGIDFITDYFLKK